MRQNRERYEVRACTASLDHGQSVDGKIYTNLHEAQRAADAWEARYGEPTIEADLTSGVLRFSNPKQLEELVRLARKLHWSKDLSPVTVRSREWALIKDVANVQLSDDPA